MQKLVLLFVLLIVAGVFVSLTFESPQSESPEYRYFKTHVVHILNRSCNRDCHGSPPEIYWRDMKSPAHAGKHSLFRYLVSDGTGLIQTPEQVRIAYDKCREQVTLPDGRRLRRIDYRNPARFSLLVRSSLARVHSGTKHAGGDVFASPEEQDFQRLLQWVQMEVDAHPERSEPITHEAERFFRDSVMPVLVKKNCFGANCHGILAFSDLRFDTGVNFGADDYGAVIKGVSYDPGNRQAGLDRQSSIRESMRRLPTTGGGYKGSDGILRRFSDEMIRTNRRSAMGAVTGRGSNLVTLGDIEQSKFLLKNIPLSEGGILHKGGNNFFVSRDDPDFQTLVQWLKIEKEKAEKAIRSENKPLNSGIGEVLGILFVRTDSRNRRRFFEVDTFLPGARLYVLPLDPGERPDTAAGPALDLSAQMGLTGREDLRSPALRYDARRVLFSMRRVEDDSFNIYEIALNDDLSYREGSLRRLTHGPGHVNGLRVHFVYPGYMPHPYGKQRFDLSQASVMFASNLAGRVTASEPRGILGQADGGSRSSILDYQRTEADGTFAGRRVHVVSGANIGQWRRIVDHRNRIESNEPSVLRVAPGFPEPVDETSVYVIEPQSDGLPGYLPAYDIYRMRYASIGNEKHAFEKTVNRITFNSDQNLNPAMRSAGEVIFTSLRNLQYRAGKPVYNAGLFRVHLNGCDFHPHNMNRSGYPVVTDNRELPSGIEIRIGMDSRNLWGGGALMFSDHQFGPDIEPDNPVDSLVQPYGKRPFDHRVPSRSSVSAPSSVKAIVPGEGTLKLRHSAFRFVRANMPMFPEVGAEAIAFTGISPGGFFRDPFPMPDGSVLVSHCPRPVDHLDADANPDTDIYLVRPKVSLQAENEFNAGEMLKIRIGAASARGTSEIYPRPITVRLKEAHKAENFAKVQLGPPATIRGFTGYPDLTTSFIECYDYYALDQLLVELAPVSRRLIAVPRDPVSGEPVAPIDQARFVRIILVPPRTPRDITAVDPDSVRNRDRASTNLSNGIHAPKVVVCEVPLPKDGSFYVEIPSRLPYYYQTLNADRMAVRTFDKLLCTVPGEKVKLSVPRHLYPMICAGCHGSTSGRREDVLRRPDVVTSASKVSATWDTDQKKKKKPFNDGYAANRLTSLDFVRDIQPILYRKCSGCHGGAEPAAGLSLTGKPTAHYTDAYESLMQLEDADSGNHGQKAYVDERNARAISSYLIEKLYGRELKAYRKLEGDIPHPSEAPLSDEEKLTLVRWIDAGATFKGAALSTDAETGRSRSSNGVDHSFR